MMTVIILCGGLASRLYPLSETTPKSLIEIHKKPFIHYQLEQLHQQHITDVILCVGKFGDIIEEKIGNKYKNITIQYSHDGELPLGTGGAIKKALSLIPENDFIVLYGDSYLQIPINKMINKYYASKKPILMSVYRNKNKLHKNNIIYNGEILSYDKELYHPDMTHIDYGINIFNKSVFVQTPHIFDLSKLLTDFVKIKQVSSIEATVSFHEVGSFKGIEKFEKFIVNKL